MAQSDFGKAVSRETAKAKAAPKKAAAKSVAISGGNSEPPKKRGRVENLKPFKPGQSGNPAGRPRNTVSDSIRHLLQTRTKGDKTYADAIAEKVVDMAINGDLKAAEILLDRSEGKVTQPISGPGGKPLQLELSPSERLARLMALTAKGRTK